MSAEQTLRIRRATRADAALLVTFHRALYVEHRDRIMPPRLAPFFAYRDLDAALREDVAALLGQPDSIVLVAEQNGHAIGYVTGHIEHDERRVLPRKGVIEDWLVLERARGTGIGRQLFERLCDVFRGAGCDVVESTTWPFNEGAVRAHEALGFELVEVKYRKRV